MQMISEGSTRASRVDWGRPELEGQRFASRTAPAPVSARHCSLNGGDSTRPTRTARAGREAAHSTYSSIVRPQHARRAPILQNPYGERRNTRVKG